MFKKYFRKDNLKTIGKVSVVAAVFAGAVALGYAIGNICYCLYHITDETLTIRKQLTKLNMAHKIDLKKKYDINIDTFMKEYESRLEAEMLDESNDDIVEDDDVEEDFVCED
jgi:hypothetical protein